MGDEPRGLLQFRMLGPLEAWRGDTPLRLGGERQRALLALLLVHANHLVRTEQLVDQLLGGDVSDQALNTTRVAVSRLRRLLEDGDPGELLLTQAGGYVLNAGPEQLDVARFERLFSDGRGLLAGGDAASAAARLREALALWRGPPLADLAVLEFVRPEIRRLEELRLLAVMERIDADLALGAHAELIPELEGLVASNPLQERLRVQLMLALYRAGRQAEALQVYRQTSELLREELGLEPSRGLKELERQILRQDPTLELAPGAVTMPSGTMEERAVCPYKGLASFDRSDADYFCGRERMVSDLVARLAESTLVGIVGPSGIGKSSLLRAGLLSALSRGELPGSAGWRQLLVRPGERPCAELARALRGEELDVVLAGVTPGDRMVLAVDQLEELFTVCEHEGERVAFLDQLAAAACDAERRLLVVVALRADFYGRCATYTRFAELLSSSHVLVGPMPREELARAIELPAARAGLDVERALVDDLVADVAGEPGGLPLLSTMLLELWRVRDGRVLRLERYAASGGVRGAVARLAEDAYVRLDEPGRRVARGLLLRLAHGEDGALVRRRLPVADLERIDGAQRVVATLTDARLLTVTDGEVELSHEALLREWPRYRTWLEEDRVGRRLHAHMSDISREWDAGGRDPGDLYRGARLTAAADWSAQHRDELSPVELEFLSASRGAAGRAARRLRAVLAAVAALLVVSIIAGVLALVQKQHATSEARVALGQQLGAEAVSEPRIDLAMLLAREAVNLDPSQQTESTLLATLERNPAVIGTLALPANAPPDLLALSPDGRMLAVVSPPRGYSFGSLRLYDLRTHAAGPGVADFLGGSQPVYSGDGSLLVYPAFSRLTGLPYLAVRDAHTLALRAALEFGRSQSEGFPLSVLIAPDGRTVYCACSIPNASGNPGVLYLESWSLPSGRRLASMRVGYGFPLASGLLDGGARLMIVWAGSVTTFDTRSLRRLRTVPITRPATPGPAAISPDGRMLVIGSQTGRVSFIDLSSGIARAGRGGHGALVSNVVYSPNGRTVTTTGNDGKVIVWDPETATPVEVLNGPVAQAGGAALSADGQTLYTSSLDGVVLAWDLTGDHGFGRRVHLGPGLRCCGPLSPPTPPLAVSPDGSRFAVLLAASTVGLFSTSTLQRQASFTVAPRSTVITSLAWSPTSPALAVGGYSGLVQLWNLAGPPRLTRTFVGLQATSKTLPEAIQSVAFSPDGTLLAAADETETPLPPSPTQQADVAIWQASTGNLVAERLNLGLGPPGSLEVLAFPADDKLAVSQSTQGGATQVLDTSTLMTRRTLAPLGGDTTVSLAAAPDGTLAAGTSGGTVQLWNSTSGAPPADPLLAALTPIASIAFNATGQQFATTSAQDGEVKLWFTSTLQQEGATLNTEKGATSTVAFEPNGGNLLAVDDHGNAFTWPTSAAAWEQRACAIAGRNLTREEWSRYVPGQAYTRVCP